MKYFSPIVLVLKEIFSKKVFFFYLFLLIIISFFLMGFFQVYSTISPLLSFSRPLGSSVLLLYFSVFGFYAETISRSNLIVSFVTSFLFSLQIIFSYYYFKKRGSLLLQTGSFLGMFFSLVGVGCASCGAVVFSTLLSFFGLTGVLSKLPWGGEEVAFLGIFFLCFSLYTTARKITEPLVC